MQNHAYNIIQISVFIYVYIVGKYHAVNFFLKK